MHRYMLHYKKPKSGRLKSVWVCFTDADMRDATQLTPRVVCGVSLPYTLPEIWARDYARTMPCVRELFQKGYLEYGCTNFSNRKRLPSGKLVCN